MSVIILEPLPDGACACAAVGRGVQTFRIRHPDALFEVLADLDGDRSLMIGARAVWTCRGCGQRFAWMRMPFKDDEEILVRASTPVWQQWDWATLATIAESCRWRGPDLDAPYVV